MTPLPTALDLFSGCGGGSLGVEAAGFHLIGAVEIDEAAAASYRRTLGIDATVADIREVTPECFAPSGPQGELTLLFGCPPCQSFTDLRRGRPRTVADDARDAMPSEFLRFVSALRPRSIAFENVPGLVRGRNRASFDRFTAALKGLGYGVAWSVLDAADFGVPQHRRRLVLVGSRVAVPRLPEPTHGPRSPGLRAHNVVRDAIGALPPLATGQASESDPMHRARRHSTLVIERLQHLDPGGSRSDLPLRLQLRCHLDHDGHKDAYGRMSWDKPAPTLTSGCTNVSRGRFCHPEQHRAITAREALLLQSFPDGTILVGGAEAVAAQIGNAVPPPMATAIAAAVLRADPQGPATEEATSATMGE